MFCPYCTKKRSYVVKFGFFSRSVVGREKVQRYLCKTCRRHFSDQVFEVSYRQKKPHLDQTLFRMLNSSVSQRRSAFILGLTKKTVAKKVMRLGAIAKAQLHQETTLGKKVATVVFDEMETFNHTKCKPLSIPLAVEEGSRRILAVGLAQMPAKGPLAAISLKKYGFRADHRARALKTLMREVGEATLSSPVLKSDKCPRYPRAVRGQFTDAKHIVFKGRRACTVGQGEMKVGGFDPLFSLNHTCAMFRDNLKRLSRRTWCTTKKPECLSALLSLYSCYHNSILQNKKRPPKLRGAHQHPRGSV